jgi:hypothetical protein
MPEVNEDTMGLLSKLDHRHTFLLDVGLKEFRGDYPGVYQNFEKDIFSILMDSEALVRKYKRLFLLFPDGLRTTDIISGFQKFGKKKIIATEVQRHVKAADIRKGDAYIVIDDNNLVDIIMAAREKNWQLGKDIGIISYNETNLKSVIGNGITTITTDFAAMGKTMAEMVVSGQRSVVENPFVMIDRKSF